MRTYEFEFTTEIKFSLPVTNHNFVLKCMPISNVSQLIYDETLIISPSADFTLGTDSFGNKTVNGSINSPHKEFMFSVKGKAHLSKYKIMDDIDRVYLYPSKNTHMSKEMNEFFNSLDLPVTPKEKAVCISKAVYEYMSYVKGSTTVDTTASEAFALKMGVCQDYAHITTALLRKAGIPARYAAGFIEGDGETHAWVEYYCNGAWYGIDPTNNNEIEYGYIKLSHGLDSSSAGVERGCFVSNEGIVTQLSEITVKVGEIND